MEIVEQLTTLEWTKLFLQWLPETYRKNIFEAMKTVSLNLDRPNITEEDIQNIKLAFEVLRDNWLLTPQNIASLNHIIYQEDSIDIDGIIFDRNNLSWWDGIYREETDERYYNKEAARSTLKKQGKKTFKNYDVWDLFDKNRPHVWYNGSKDKDWKGMTYWLNLLWIILWCKRSWYVTEDGKLENMGMWYLKLKSEIFKDSSCIKTPLYLFDKRTGSCTVHRFVDERYPIRPILWYNKKI
jgi:hypothetical protein